MNSRSLRRSRLRRRGARLLILILAVVTVAVVASCAAKAHAERGPSAKAVELREAMDKTTC